MNFGNNFNKLDHSPADIAKTEFGASPYLRYANIRFDVNNTKPGLWQFGSYREGIVQKFITTSGSPLHYPNLLRQVLLAE